MIISNAKRTGISNIPPDATFVAGVSKALVVQGRRGVRIFGFSDHNFGLLVLASIFIGIPLCVFIAMIPFWERVGEFPLIRELNSYGAPAVDGVSSDYRYPGTPRFPTKRFLIASTSIVELIFLANFIALLTRRARRHALLVWTCYDRAKLMQYFAVSSLLFFVAWFLLFSDWTVVKFVSSTHNRGAGRIMAGLIMTMPTIAFVFGHLASIIVLGSYRTLVRKFSRPRPNFAREVTP